MECTLSSFNRDGEFRGMRKKEQKMKRMATIACVMLALTFIVGCEAYYAEGYAPNPGYSGVYYPGPRPVREWQPAPVPGPIVPGPIVVQPVYPRENRMPHGEPYSGPHHPPVAAPHAPSPTPHPSAPGPSVHPSAPGPSVQHPSRTVPATPNPRLNEQR